MTRYDGMAFDPPEIKETEHGEAGKQSACQNGETNGIPRQCGEGAPLNEYGECQSFIYFIRAASGAVKIGCSKEPHKRLVKVTEWVPEKVSIEAMAPGGLAVEQALHARFRLHRIGGEWFHPCPELEELIAHVKAGGDIPIRSVEREEVRDNKADSYRKMRLSSMMTLAERKFYGKRVWNRRPQAIVEMQRRWKGAFNFPSDSEIEVVREYVRQLKARTYKPDFPGTSFAAFLTEPTPEPGE